MAAAVVEAEARAGREVAHRCRHEDLARVGCRLDPGGDVDGETADVSGADVALAGVEAGADLQAEAGELVTDGPGALDGPGGGVEGGQEAVAESLDLLALPAPELLADDGVVLFQQRPPGGVAEFL